MRNCLVVKEAERIPWWGRIWRRDYARDVGYILPMPLCWLARFVWNVWCLSFIKWRPNALERLLRERSGEVARLDRAERQDAHQIRLAHSFNAGVRKGKVLGHNLALEILGRVAAEPGFTSCSEEEFAERWRSAAAAAEVSCTQIS